MKLVVSDPVEFVRFVERHIRRTGTSRWYKYRDGERELGLCRSSLVVSVSDSGFDDCGIRYEYGWVEIIRFFNDSRNNLSDLIYALEEMRNAYGNKEDLTVLVTNRYIMLADKYNTQRTYIYTLDDINVIVDTKEFEVYSYDNIDPFTAFIRFRNPIFRILRRDKRTKHFLKFRHNKHGVRIPSHFILKYELLKEILFGGDSPLQPLAPFGGQN